MYSKRSPWFFLGIPIILLLVFTVIPVFSALYLSFTKYNAVQPPEWIGFANYVKAINEPMVKQAFFNTIKYWMFVTPALVILPIFLAILVNQKLKGIKLFRLIYYFPVLVSVVISSMLFKMVFAESGLLNNFLGALGKSPVAWLTSPNISLISVAMVTIWQGVGYYMLFYLAALQAVPSELYEAADLDGANFWQKHLRITIPSIMPMIYFVATVSTISAFKEFTLMMTMTKGGPLNATKTVVYLVFEEAFTRLNLGYASAISFILFTLILCISLVNQFVLDRNPK